MALSLIDVRDRLLLKLAADSLEVEDEDKRIVRGWASTTDRDEVGDIVESTFWRKAMPAFMKSFPNLYYNHERWGGAQPIGKVIEYEISDKGLYTWSQVTETEGKGGGKNTLMLVHDGVIKAQSVGIWVTKYVIEEQNDDRPWTRRCKEGMMFDLSLCDIPVNRSALLDQTKKAQLIEWFQSQKSVLFPGIDINPVASSPGGGEEMSFTLEDVKKTSEQVVGDALKEHNKGLATTVEATTRDIVKTSVTPKMDELSQQVTVLKGDNERQFVEIKNALQGAVTKADLEAMKETVKADLMTVLSSQQAKSPGFTAFPLNGMGQPLIAGNGAYRFKTASEYEVNLCNEFKLEKAYMRGVLYKAEHTVTPNLVELFKAVQETNDFILILDAVARMTRGVNYGGMKTLKAWEHWTFLMEETKKALATTNTGFGLEWIPRALSADLLDRVEMDLVVARGFRTFNAPTKTWDYPLRGGRLTAWRMNEATTDTAAEMIKSTFGTAIVTFIAEKLAVACLISEEETEDAFLPVIDVAREEIALALGRGIDDASVNGDTAAVHQDSGVTNALDVRKSWDGLRKKALAAAGSKLSNAGAKLSASGVIALGNLRKKMGERGRRLSELRYLLSLGDYMNLLLDTTVTTVDKIGNMATYLQGALAAVHGIRVEVSEFQQVNLDANGVQGGALSAPLLIHNPSFGYAERRATTLDVQRIPLTDQNAVFATDRRDFQCLYPSDTYPVVILHNTDPT